MDLIDREALLKQLGISDRFNATVPPYIIGVIKGMPRQEIIKCKDCKHNAHIPQRYADNILWSCWDVDPDGYCSKAERREE